MKHWSGWLAAVLVLPVAACGDGGPEIPEPAAITADQGFDSVLKRRGRYVPGLERSPETTPTMNDQTPTVKARGTRAQMERAAEPGMQTSLRSPQFMQAPERQAEDMQAHAMRQAQMIQQMLQRQRGGIEGYGTQMGPYGPMMAPNFMR